MRELYTVLLKRREDMVNGMFTHPPSDWEEFQKRLGMWVELTRIIEMIEGKERQQEQEDGQL